MTRKAWILFLGLGLGSAGCDCGGKTGQGKGELQIDETQIDFGAVCRKPTGQGVAIDSSTRILHASNVGPAALDVEPFEIAPTDQFSLDATTVPSILGAAEAIEVPVTFIPTQAGSVTGSVTIKRTSEGKDPIVVTLLGTAKPADPDPVINLSCPGGKWSNDSCAVANPNIFFKDASAGTSELMDLKLTNTGCPPLEVTKLKVTTTTAASYGTFSLVESKTALAVAPGATATVGLRFSPLTKDSPPEGSLVGELTFDTNDPRQKTVTLPLRGIGIEAQLGLEPNACQMGSLTAPCDGHFTISNNTAQGLTVVKVSLKNASPMFQLTQAPAPNSTLASGATDTVIVSYTPSMTFGADTLQVDWSGGQLSAALTGGSPPVVGTDIPSVDFGDKLTVSQDYYLPIQITNVSSYARQLPLSLGSVEVDTRPPSNAAVFSVAADPANPVTCPASQAPVQLAAGGSAKACLHFRTDTGGVPTFTANLLIKSNDPARPDPDGLLLPMVASTGCNRPPIADVTSPTGEACPGGTCPVPDAGFQATCIAGQCAQIGSAQTVLGAGSIVLSGATSFDLTVDGQGNCTVHDPAAVAQWEWTLTRKPFASTAATLTPAGKGAASQTTLAFDVVGLYQVTLKAWDQTNLFSPEVNFNVTVGR